MRKSRVAFYSEWFRRAFSGWFGWLDGAIGIAGLVMIMLNDVIREWGDKLHFLAWAFPLAALACVMIAGLMNAPYKMHLEQTDDTALQAENARLRDELSIAKNSATGNAISEEAKATKVASVQKILLEHAELVNQPFDRQIAKDWIAEAYSLLEAAGLWRETQLLSFDRTANDEVCRQQWKKAAGALKGVAGTLEYKQLKS